MSSVDARALGIAIGENRGDAARLMIALGWPLTTEGEWGGTPLHGAAWHGRVHMARWLLAHGAPVNVRDSWSGSSPIAWAAHGSTNCDDGVDDDYVTIVSLLVDAGATRAESYNQWNESPESMASPAVVRMFETTVRSVGGSRVSTAFFTTEDPEASADCRAKPLCPPRPLWLIFSLSRTSDVHSLLQAIPLCSSPVLVGQLSL